jgi:hypothetical protein
MKGGEEVCMGETAGVRNGWYSAKIREEDVDL